MKNKIFILLVFMLLFVNSVCAFALDYTPVPDRDMSGIYEIPAIASANALSISSGNYNPGTLIQGESYQLSGTISSNYDIWGLDIGILNADGSRTPYGYYVEPNAKSYTITETIAFEELAAGTYILRIIARDVKNYETLVYNTFVIEENAITAPLSISSGNYDPGTLIQGESYQLSGTISSNRPLTEVYVGISDANGNVCQSAKATPNTTYYNISNLAGKLNFASLAGNPEGITYYLKISASNDTVSTLLSNKSFKVIDRSNKCKEHKYTSASGDVCTVCGYIFQHQLSEYNQGVIILEDNTVVRDKPYSGCGKVLETLNAGKYIGITHKFQNSLGNLWYVTKEGNYIYSENVRPAKNFKLTFVANGDNVKNLPESKNVLEGVKYGLSFTVSPPSRAGYNFLGYSTNKNSTSPEFSESTTRSIMLTKNTVLYLIWEKNPNANSTISIGSGNYNPGTLTAGSTYSINGLISSKNRLTLVTVGIYDADGTKTDYVKTISPNSTTYDIKKVDNYIKFGKLIGSSSGTKYYFKITARDSNGVTVELVNNSFVVKGREEIKLSDDKYKAISDKTYEVQVIKSGCVLTSYSMLVKSKLYYENKDYTSISQYTIKEYNNGSLNAYWGTINNNIDKKAGTSGTITSEGKPSSSSKTNKEYIINLLKSRPEGIVVYFSNSAGSHAVRFCNYDSTTDTFYVDDPGSSQCQYVPLLKSTIAGKKYTFGTTYDTIFKYIERIIYWK